MNQNRKKKRYSLRFLVLRAVVVITVVVVLLLVLRHENVIVRERDVPATIVEEITRENEVSVPSGVEAP